MRAALARCGELRERPAAPRLPRLGQWSSAAVPPAARCPLIRSVLFHSLVVAWVVVLAGSPLRGELRAGAAAIDVTPLRFPVLVNGGMTSRTATQATTPLFARAVVLDDGEVRLAIVVVDSCMMPRALLDEAKQLIASRTAIRPDRVLISATHTHTAPASMGCLGTDADPTYIPYLREKLAEAVSRAASNLEPARVGWGVTNAADFTAVRRWILRPDRIARDPFGNPTVRANMHAARNLDDVTGESGPEDPDLSLLSVQAADGRPIAVLANFSMHYFSGEQQLSADYFGRFCGALERHLGHSQPGRAPFVGIMSHGCSGDIWRRDYARWDAAAVENEPTIDSYTAGLVELALDAYRRIEHADSASLAMAEARLPMKYRVPDAQRLEWARRVVAEMGDRLPKDQPEVYAREQIYLHDWQSTEVVVQAMRIGDIAIATTPNETYALTGLKLKLQSPLPRTMVIELANGGDGYIPPPEQHALGGYNTWPARSAGLEVDAEPRITAAALELLEQVAGRPRREYRDSDGAGAEAVRAMHPVAYFRMDEFSAPAALDRSGGQRHGIYEPGVVFFLEGPRSPWFCDGGDTNRAAHFAGGRMRARFENLESEYSVSLWIWNGMPEGARGTTGWMFSRGRDRQLRDGGEHLGLGGTETQPGRLVFHDGREPVAGRTTVPRWTWSHVALVRNRASVQVYLNGALEIDAESSAARSATGDEWFFGGRCDGQANWEGRLDEIAIFARALGPDDVKRLVPNSSP